MTTLYFYTYAYLRESGTPYYIGKGCKGRCHSRHHRVPVPPKERILILKSGLSEEEAWSHEKYMIFVFGRKDLGTGILLNCTDGGEGSAGAIRSPEFKAGVSRYMRENHPMRGKPSPCRGLTLWRNIETDEMTFQEVCPGDRWVKGRPDYLIEQHSGENNPNFGKKWWYNPDTNETRFDFSAPSSNWKEGRPKFKESSCQKMSIKKKDGKWWVNSEGATKYSAKKPEGDWKRGRKW
jgi:hypothetical protein